MTHTSGTDAEEPGQPCPIRAVNATTITNEVVEWRASVHVAGGVDEGRQRRGSSRPRRTGDPRRQADEEAEGVRRQQGVARELRSRAPALPSMVAPSGSAALFQCDPSSDPPTPASPNTVPATTRTRFGPQVGHDADERRDGDQQQRRGRGVLRALTGGVHERAGTAMRKPDRGPPGIRAPDRRCHDGVAERAPRGHADEEAERGRGSSAGRAWRWVAGGAPTRRTRGQGEPRRPRRHRGHHAAAVVEAQAV